MTRAPFNVRKHRVAVAHPNHAAHDLSVERRRREVDMRWRPLCNGVASEEELERYFMDRSGQKSGGLLE